MKLSAIEVQKLLNVADNVVIAHGYDHDRNTIDIFFENGELVRVKTPYGKSAWVDRAEEFHSTWITYIKRWYRGTEKRGINPTLVNLFETFGSSLPITDGGTYP